MLNNRNIFPTGYKDVDRKILSELPDRDLLLACQTNDYTHNKVCDETFFRNLVYNRYPETIKYKDYVKIRDWKNFYLSVIYYIDKLEKEYNFIYSEEKKKNKDISPELEYLSRKTVPTYIKYTKDEALIWAAGNGYLEIVKYLIENDADIHAKDDEALKSASASGHLEIVKYLKEKGADNDEALKISSLFGHLPVVKYLVENNANIHADDDSALRWASGNGHLEIVKYLVENEANIHANNDEALRYASRNGHLAVVKYLKSLP